MRSKTNNYINNPKSYSDLYSNSREEIPETHNTNFPTADELCDYILNKIEHSPFIEKSTIYLASKESFSPKMLRFIENPGDLFRAPKQYSKVLIEALINTPNEFFRLVNNYLCFVGMLKTFPEDAEMMMKYVLNTENEFYHLIQDSSQLEYLLGVGVKEFPNCVRLLLDKLLQDRALHFERLIDVNLLIMIAKEYPDYSDWFIKRVLDEEHLVRLLDEDLDLYALAKAFPKINILKLATVEEAIHANKKLNSIYKIENSVEDLMLIYLNKISKDVFFKPCKNDFILNAIISKVLEFTNPSFLSPKEIYEVAKNKYHKIISVLNVRQKQQDSFANETINPSSHCNNQLSSLLYTKEILKIIKEREAMEVSNPENGYQSLLNNTKSLTFKRYTCVIKRKPKLKFLDLFSLLQVKDPSRTGFSHTILEMLREDHRAENDLQKEGLPRSTP